jgi:hypothetical protein
VHELARGQREPALHFRSGKRLARQPLARRVVAQREIHQDRVAVRQHHLAVFDHRNLGELVLGEKRRLRVLSAQQVDLDALEGQVEHREQELDAMAMSGDGVAMESDGMSHAREHGSQLDPSEWLRLTRHHCRN